jgi:hypothetical protein
MDYFQNITQIIKKIEINEVIQSYLFYWWLICSEFVVKINKPCTNIFLNNFCENDETVSIQVAITEFCYRYILHNDHSTLATLISFHNVFIFIFQMYFNKNHILIIKIGPVWNHRLMLWISWFVSNLDFCLTTNSNYNDCQRSTCIFIKPIYFELLNRLCIVDATLSKDKTMIWISGLEL